MQTLRIHVKTRSGKSEILGYNKEKDAVLVNVKTPPEEGKANIEVLKLFHRAYRKPVRIMSGATSKYKLIRIG